MTITKLSEMIKQNEYKHKTNTKNIVIKYLDIY